MLLAAPAHEFGQTSSFGVVVVVDGRLMAPARTPDSVDNAAAPAEVQLVLSCVLFLVRVGFGGMMALTCCMAQQPLG